MDARKAVFRIVLGITLSTVLAFLAGCGTKNQSLAVADSGNSRVVIYNAPLSTDKSASVVLGQANFTQGSANRGSGPTANSLSTPLLGIASDSTGGLYVVDTHNCRVLYFEPPFTNGMDASKVLGQPGFTSNGCAGGGANVLNYPFSAAVDGKGDLWVADMQNSRVLEYVPPFSNGVAATLVIGEQSLAATGPQNCSATSNQLCFPYGLTFDSTGNLWVADGGDNRVLEFQPPFSTGMAASLEIGQPDFTSNLTNRGGGASANSLWEPASVTFGSSGDLWVTDSQNDRVLEYVPPFTNGMAATTVLGQVDFVHMGPNVGTGFTALPNGFSMPWGLNFDSSGDLLVADSENNRVVRFSPPFSNGMPADIAVGQAGLAGGSVNQDNGGPPSANSLWWPSAAVEF